MMIDDYFFLREDLNIKKAFGLVKIVLIKSVFSALISGSLMVPYVKELSSDLKD